MTQPPPTKRLHNRIGDGLVVWIALGMLLTPVISTVIDVPLDPVALSVRAMVVGLVLVTIWAPTPMGRDWRRMMAISMMAAHHVGVGVAAGMPDALLVELVGGAALAGSLACWLLPRSGFGLLISTTLALGTLALGIMPPASDLGRLLVWVGVFLLGGVAAELSVWLAPRMRIIRVEAPAESETGQASALDPIGLLDATGLGCARLHHDGHEFLSASEQLSQMVASWDSVESWWKQVLTRGRNPTQPDVTTQIEMLSPAGSRHSFRLRLVQLPPVAGQPRPLLVAEDITERVSARREASDLRTQLEHVQREAQIARQARERALRSRSHHLRTPLHNLRTNLELLEAALNDGASSAKIRAELARAHRATNQMVLEVNGLLDGMVRGGDAAMSGLLDVVVVVDTALDELAGSRTVHRNYSQKSLPIRGPRAELTTLIRDLVKSTVGAANDPMEVQVHATERGFVRLSFHATPADDVLVRMVLAALASRVAGVGGESKLEVTSSPTIFLPEDRSKARGVEAEVTWPGELPGGSRPPVLRAPPSTVSVFGVSRIDPAEATDDEPTHLLRVRARARRRP